MWTPEFEPIGRKEAAGIAANHSPCLTASMTSCILLVAALPPSHGDFFRGRSTGLSSARSQT